MATKRTTPKSRQLPEPSPVVPPKAPAPTDEEMRAIRRDLDALYARLSRIMAPPARRRLPSLPEPTPEEVAEFARKKAEALARLRGGAA